MDLDKTPHVSREVVEEHWEQQKDCQKSLYGDRFINCYLFTVLVLLLGIISNTYIHLECR